MRYQVPQFIEVEDKIFGPLTIKQFIYLAGGGGLCLIFFSFLPLYITILLSLPVLVFSLSLAFYEINGRPFLTALEHAVRYFFGAKLYLWKQKMAGPSAGVAKQGAQNTPAATLLAPKLSDSRLKDLAWSLNIKDRSGISAPKNETAAQFEI